MATQKELFAKELFKIARSDIKASKILYANRLYPQSFFYFQQATEKATKAYYLLSDFIDEKRSFDIRHNLFKLHRKILVDVELNTNSALNLLNDFPFFEIPESFEKEKIKEQLKSIQQGISAVDGLNQIDLINIPAKDIRLFLSHIESLKVKGIKTPAELGKKVDAFFESFIASIQKYDSKEAIYVAMVLKEILTSTEWKEFIRNHFTELIKISVDSMYAFSTLYFASYLTIQHSTLSRYPENNNAKRSPAKIYSKNLPSVKYQLHFLDHITTAITLLEKIFK